MSSQAVTESVIVNAPADVVFSVIADASRHPDFDGSGTVKGSRQPSQPLTLGSRFGMDMRLGPLPYAMSNTVVEYEPDRLIAWQHLGRHRWRYELEPVDGTHTRVTESFDWSTAPLPTRTFIKMAGYPQRNQQSIRQTLGRLAALLETEVSDDSA